MKFKAFHKWLSDTFGGLTFEALCSKAGIGAQGEKGDQGDPGADGADGADGSDIDISALAAVTTLNGTDLILVQVGVDLKKITFDDFVTAVTTAQGA